MAGVSEEVPEGAGPNASMQFGDATRTAAMLKEMQSAGSPAGGQPGGAQPPTAPPPGAGPATPPQNLPVQPAPVDLRLDPSQVFSAPPGQPAPPWRDRLRQWARHPEAGPAIQALADLIDKQRGPLEKGGGGGAV